MKPHIEPITKPVFKLGQPDDNYKYRALPSPTGKYPYHLNIQDVVAGVNTEKMVFHMGGDTGSITGSVGTKQVVSEMAGQYKASRPEDRPQFFYHLGDIVYHHGEADRFDKQFFEPFAPYPGPIFAIAGNHDSDVNPDSPVVYQSLDSFKAVFCDTVSRKVSFSAQSARKSMVQPNVYWTLETPLANIIGLHSNIPKYGVITNEQREWFIAELKTADAERGDKALLICVHHAPYSADTNHGSSQPMINFLEGVFEETGIKPDMVLSGHVHNYQRFSKQYADGKTVPYIVAGSGGFDELNALANATDKGYTNKSSLFDDVQLEAYCDNKHGFLKISIEKTTSGLSITGKYYALSSTNETNGKAITTLADHFTIPLAELAY
ncbi:metallophosphoesterase family protein [Mucilaginibacter pineti]|nr:metallophosphoesterase [Mucilaginibacter pineti]